jgi:hypothetical protein
MRNAKTLYQLIFFLLLVDSSDVDRREGGHRHLYHMALTDQLVIDATTHGGRARFLNHSCEPNCRIENWIVGRERRIGIFSERSIGADAELTIDYQYARTQGKCAVQQMCFCGAATCEGFIGWKRRGKKGNAGRASTSSKSSASASSLEPVSSSLSRLLPSTKRNRQAPVAAAACDRSREENVCFSCLDDDSGQLLICEEFFTRGVPCTKVYHLACLYLDRAPSGRFRCPWHSCDVCAKTDGCFTHCISCTSAWCKKHVPSAYSSDEFLQFVVGGDDANIQKRFILCSHCNLDVRFIFR